MRKTIHSEEGQLLGSMLRELRESAGLTQRELCRLLEREHSFVSKYELGERRVDIVEFYWICLACGANPETEARRIMRAFKAREAD